MIDLFQPMTSTYRSATARAAIVAESAAMGAIETACARHQQNLRRLERAAQAGDAKKVKKLCRAVLASPQGKLSALVRTIKYNPGVPYTLSTLLQLVRKLNSFVPIDERVAVKLKKKGTDSYRFVCSFGWIRRAVQQLCADALKVSLPAYAFDFMEKGNGGPEGAAVRLAAIIKEAQCDLVVVADIRNCFGAVKKDGVAQLLPLPAPAVLNALLIQNTTKTKVELTVEGGDIEGSSTELHQLTHEADTAARLGLPQGSLASTIIMSRAILGPTLAATPFVERVVLHGDDIAVPAKGEAEAEFVLNTLRSRLESNGPAGPLTIGHHHIYTATDYVNFCKYKLKRSPEVFGGGIRFSPTTRGLQKFDDRVKLAYLRAAKGDEAVSVAKYVTAWKSSYPLWHRNGTAEDNIAMATEMAMHEGWREKYGPQSSVDSSLETVQSIAQEDAS